MAMDFGLQFPLICDKEDESLQSYLGRDCLLNEFESADILSPTFGGDDLVDHLVRQLETQNNQATIQQSIRPSGSIDFAKPADQSIGNSGLFSLADQDGFLQFLDELDVDITGDNNNKESGDEQPNSNSGTESWEEAGMTIVDEHDYAKGHVPRMPLSASYSSVEEESCHSESDSQSPFTYERQMTSNSSSSSITYDFAVPRAAPPRTELIFDSSDTESQPVQKQRRSNFALPNPKPVKITGGDSYLKRKYPPLNLTEEERQLCEKERVYLPDHYPLTKEEERKLRGIRRKIRNKASAQLSRKKKQEYIEALEHRATDCSEENEVLKRTVKMLTSQNNKLQSQLQKLQAALANNGRRSAQTGTCLAVLLLSFALLIAPEYGPFGKRNMKNQLAKMDETAATMTPGNTRTLLQFYGPTQDPVSLRDDDHFSLSDANRYFYDNESAQFESQTMTKRKRKMYLTPPDASPDFGSDIPEMHTMAKRMKLADPIPDVLRVDLDVYKTPGISNESHGATFYQEYEVMGRKVRTEGM